MFQSIMIGMKNAGMLPRLSDTERQALEAGDVWAEGEFFKGNPDFKALLASWGLTAPKLDVDELATMLKRGRCASMRFHALPCPSTPFHDAQARPVRVHALPCPSMMPFHAFSCPSMPSMPFHDLP